MTEKQIISIWKKYNAAKAGNTVDLWKKYLLSCVRVNVFPPVGKYETFIDFVEAMKDNIFEVEKEENENGDV